MVIVTWPTLAQPQRRSPWTSIPIQACMSVIIIYTQMASTDNIKVDIFRVHSGITIDLMPTKWNGVGGGPKWRIDLCGVEVRGLPSL